MKVIFHVGPHKTATTSIQEFLQRNRVALLDQQVYVPPSLTDFPGHHELPWALLGWDQRLIGARQQEKSARKILRRALRQARARKARTVIFSSEDFSLLKSEDWSKLVRCLPWRDRKRPQVTVVYTKRPLAALVASAYPTLVALGYSGTRQASEAPVLRHFEHTYQTLSTLASVFGPRGETVELSLQETEFLELFAARVFPAVSVKDFVGFDYRANESLPESLTTSWLEVNKKWAPAFDMSHPFHWGGLFTLEAWLRLRDARQLALNTANKGDFHVR